MDNDFALRFLKDTEASVVPPGSPGSSRLCGKCEEMDFWIPNFRIEDQWSDLESGSIICEFCRMRWNISKHLNRKDYPSVSFERVESVLKMNDDHTPVLSIFRSSGKILVPDE